MTNWPPHPDEESEQVSERLFARWNWKLARLVQNILLGVLAVWLLWLSIPEIISFVRGPDFVPILLQMLLLAGYLFLFISFQLFLIYFVLSRTRVYWVQPAQNSIRFRDYRGNPPVLAAAGRVVRLLQGIQAYQHSSGELLRGLLLIGPAGAGKRYLARAIAGEAGIPIGYLNATSLATSRIGLGPLKVAMLYRNARKMAREYGACILLIDQIDAIGAQDRPPSPDSGPRAPDTASADWSSPGGRRSVLYELLLQIDPPFQRRTWWHWLLSAISLSARRGRGEAVLTIGITTQSEQLDSALLRPGRFDRQIFIGLPDSAGRKEIIAYYLRRIAHATLPLERMAADMEGCPPAVIKRLLHEAAVYAHLEGRQTIIYDDVVWALELHRQAVSQPAPPISYAERRRTAYYQAGQIYLRDQLARRNGSSGSAGVARAAQQSARTKEELLAEIQIALAGRAAEEELLGIQTTSAAADLRYATQQAVLLAGAFGMDRQLCSCLAAGQGDVQQAMLDSDLRTRAEGLLQEQYRQVRALIIQNRMAVTTLAEALILHEALPEHDSSELLTRLEARYPFIDPAAKTRPAGGLVARAARYGKPQAPAHTSKRFAEPEPALPEYLPLEPPAEQAEPEQQPAASDE